MICEATWPAEPYDDVGNYFPEDYHGACPEPAVARALVRTERHGLVPLLICQYHAEPGDLRLGIDLPAA